MEKNINAVVILPTSYTGSQESYPVVYMLHGAGGDYVYYAKNYPKLQEYVNQYNLIIVCPDGEKTSWYFDSPVDPQFQYETFFTKELLPRVDKHYRTIPHASHRAIMGLSMGGHGAFYLAIRHPNLWGAAGSMSGGMDITQFPDSWDIKKRLGAYELFPERWQSHTIHYMTSLIKSGRLALLFDCGTDDFFYDVNKALHQKLLAENIPHDFIIRPGGHDRSYWSNAIDYQFVFFSNFFEKNKILK